MGTRKRACCSQGRRPACLPLRFLLSMRLRMKKKATDRFMRDPIVLCNPTKWLVVLHHPMNDHRPLGSGKTVCWVLWPCPPVLDNSKRIASLSWFLLSKQMLHLLIQFAHRCKEEV
jgi:hypothetical protein